MKKVVLFLMLALFTVVSYSAPSKPITAGKSPALEFIAKTSLAYATATNSIPFVVEIRQIKAEIFISCELDAVSYCISNDSQIVFTLENGTAVTLQNMNGIDCSKRAKMILFVNNENQNKLRKSPVKMITMRTEDGNIDLSNIADKSFFSTYLPT